MTLSIKDLRYNRWMDYMQCPFRRARAVQLRERGHTFAAIGVDMGISRQQAAALYREGVVYARCDQRFNRHRA
jgi:hypothetical protein